MCEVSWLDVLVEEEHVQLLMPGWRFECSLVKACR